MAAMNNITDDDKKAIALAIHKDQDFFVLDGNIYQGDEADERAAYAEHLERTKDGSTFAEWCAEECCTLDEYDEDGDHLVLTDDEADEKAAEYIADSLWAFNPPFLAGVTGIDAAVFKAIAGNGRCEDNNEAIRRLVGDEFDNLVEQAIADDGRGHFLNTYDGEEYEVNLYDATGRNEYLYVYRIN